MQFVLTAHLFATPNTSNESLKLRAACGFASRNLGFATTIRLISTLLSLALSWCLYSLLYSLWHRLAPLTTLSMSGMILSQAAVACDSMKQCVNDCNLPAPTYLSSG